MEDLFNILVVFCSSLFFVKSVAKLLKDKGNLLDYCLLAFYLVHVIPLIVQLFWGVPEVFHHVNVGYAMNDSLTNYIYGLFIVIVCFLLNRLSSKLNPSILPSLSIKNSERVVNIILSLAMFAPVIVVLFSPDPSIYLDFSYFYTHSYNEDGYLFLFHRTMVSSSVLFSVVVLTYKYFRQKTDKSMWLYYLAIVTTTWIDGKRTIFLFSLVGILAVDLIKGKYSNKRTKRSQLFKTVFFVSLVFIYFFAYNEETGKGQDTEFYYLYTFYFSRMSIVKTAIYDQLYTHKLLDYPCQSVLFNALLWIPRSIWESKPVMYCIYFTTYADAASGQLDYNLQVNVWSEFISNFGYFLGPIITCYFLYFLGKISINSGSNVIYLLCTGFCVLYSVYGFEHIISYIFFIWLFFLLQHKLYHKNS